MPTGKHRADPEPSRRVERPRLRLTRRGRVAAAAVFVLATLAALFVRSPFALLPALAVSATALTVVVVYDDPPSRSKEATVDAAADPGR